MAGKIRKTAGVLLLIAAVLFSQLPSGRVSAKSSDFQTNGNVLVKYTGTDKEVTIPDHITVIGEEAFFENTTLECIEIPEGVEEIRHHAFYGCNNLKEIKLPDSVETIGNAAFAECDLLTDMAIGNGITEMGNGIFSGCPLLSDIELAEDHPTLCCEDGALMSADKTHLYEVLNGSSMSVFDMPDTIETIGKYAFWGCSNLKMVELSGALTEIPAYSFSNCRGLQAITIPYSVIRIGAKAFENCSNLQAVEIPETVKSIHDTAFDGCGELQIKAVIGTVADQFAREHVVTAISQTEYEEIRDSVLAQAQENVSKEVTQDADSENSEDDTQSESSEDDTESEESVEEDTTTGVEIEQVQTDEDVMGRTVIVSGQAVVFIDNTQQVVYSGEPPVPTEYPDVQGEQSGAMDSIDYELIGVDGEAVDAQIQEELAKKGLSIPKYTIVNGTLIADQAYYNRTGMDSYEFAEDITEIGEFAFARSGLTDIEIPNGVTTIGYGAFYHCDNLTEVTIADSVTTIAPYAFAQTPWLESWKHETGEDFLIVGDGILLAYRGSDSRIIIPDGVKSIAAECFAGHMGIVSVTFPDSVTEIGEDAFANCVNLSSIKGGDGIRKIADRAFAGCPLVTVPIGENVEEIGARAFDLSGTVREDDVVAVWFRGEEDQQLPQVSYEESTTKYYHVQNRGLSLEGINVAVVPSEDTVMEGTVLDPNAGGFRGYICTWAQGAPDAEKALVILKCTLPVEDTASIEWPEQIEVGGVSYAVTSISEDALSYYESTEWIAGLNESEENGTIELSLRSTFLVRPDLSEARIEGNEEDILVAITDDLIMEEQIRDCYEALYGESDSVHFQGLNITAEGLAGIPITSFGSNALELTVALPQEFKDKQVYVLCLDRNGQLEVVESEQMVLKQTPCLRFYAKHLSPYAILWYEGDATVPTGSGKLDESPNTGDFFEPKWLLCIGTTAIAFVLILWKEPRKKRQNK